MHPGRCTHVLDENGRARLAAGNDTIDEGIDGKWCSACLTSTEATVSAARVAPAAGIPATTVASSEASTPAVSSSTIASTSLESSATSKAAPASKASSKASAASKATPKSAAATATGGRVCVAILADLQYAPLPVVAVEILNCILCVFGSLKCHNTGALRVAVVAHVDVGAHDIPGLTEKVLQVLPSDGEWKL